MAKADPQAELFRLGNDHYERLQAYVLAYRDNLTPAQRRVVKEMITALRENLHKVAYEWNEEKKKSPSR